MNKSKILSIKTTTLKEITNNLIEGIGITHYENDIM